jgi:cytochrome bd-type quinol oxidase subunit 2
MKFDTIGITMKREAVCFICLCWIGSLGFAFFFGHEFGLVEGARIERQNQGYRFDRTAKAFE